MSLEGLSSLIQLESARLEGARQVTQNSQSVNQAVQQSGLQTASSKQNVWLQQIDAKMQKEMAEADVRRLESKLQRDRKAEQLSAMIANVVTVGSLASNLWDFGVNDLLKKDQKLGDTPSYLQAKPMDTSNPMNVNMTWINQPNSTARTGYLTQSAPNSDGTETVYQVTQSSNKQATGAKSATVSQADIRQILGENEFSKINPANGNSVRFSDLSPSQKEKVMQNLSHDISRGESENLMDALQIGIARVGVGSEVKGKSSSESKENTGLKDAKSLALAQIEALKQKSPTLRSTLEGDASKKPLDASTLAKIKSELNRSDLNETIDKMDGKTPEAMMSAISEVLTPKIQEQQPASTTVSSEDIKGIQNAVSKGEATVRTLSRAMDSLPTDEKKNITNVLAPKEKVQVQFNGKTIEFDLDQDWMKQNFPDKAGMSFSEIYKYSPDVAAKILEKKSSSVTPVTQENANKFASEINSLHVPAVPLLESLEDTLKKNGKLDKTYNTSGFNKAWEGVSTVGKGLMNVMVQTAKDSVPYYQAYLKAKDNADNTAEQLEAAKDKLEAANKKLKLLEQQINDFAVKGA